MGNFHQVIIYHIREVISRETVRFQQNAFIQIIIVNFDIAVNNIMEFGFSGFVNRLAHHKFFTGGNTFAGFFYA